MDMSYSTPRIVCNVKVEGNEPVPVVQTLLNWRSIVREDKDFTAWNSNAFLRIPA